MMKYNEKVERCAPKLRIKNLVNGLSYPPFVYMEDSDDGIWVHYVKYCENIAKQKYKRCLAMAYVEWLRQMILCDHPESILYRRAARREHKWKEMAQKFKEAK